MMATQAHELTWLIPILGRTMLRGTPMVRRSQANEYPVDPNPVAEADDEAVCGGVALGAVFRPTSEWARTGAGSYAHILEANPDRGLGGTSSCPTNSDHCARFALRDIFTIRARGSTSYVPDTRRWGSAAPDIAFS
jgi:hypothetical protein